MIVTCPSCNAKYRVRDDAVPSKGAQLKCPECATLFLAHRPAHDDRELTDAIDRLTKQNHEAEARVRDLEKRVKDVSAEAERQKAEFRRLNEEAGRALALRDRELADLRAELARVKENPSNGAVEGPPLALIAAMSPMLWGLDQAIRYLEPFAANEPALAAHLRHLQLLAAVLKRLADASSEPAS